MTRPMPVASSAAAIVALVVANLIPLAGVVLWGWSLGAILVLYWIENGIVGVLNVGKILLAEGTSEPDARPSPVRVKGIDLPPGAAAGCLIPFFLVHYGIFWIVHGVFVVVLTSVGPFMDAPGGADPTLGLPRADIIITGTVVLAVSHGISFVTNYLGRGEYHTATPQGQMMSVYGRVVVLHMTILLGAFVAAWLGNQVGVLVVLVIGKTALDLGLHLREHARAAPTPAIGP